MKAVLIIQSELPSPSEVQKFWEKLGMETKVEQYNRFLDCVVGTGDDKMNIIYALDAYFVRNADHVIVLHDLKKDSTLRMFGEGGIFHNVYNHAISGPKRIFIAGIGGNHRSCKRMQRILSRYQVDVIYIDNADDAMKIAYNYLSS